MKAFLLLLCLGVTLAENGPMHNFHVIVANKVTTDEQAVNLYSLLDEGEDTPEVTLMNDDIMKGGEAALVVAPHRVEEILGIFEVLELDYTIPFTNFQALVDREKEENDEAREIYLAQEARGLRNPPNYYMTLSQVKSYISQQAENSIATEVDANGIKGLKIDGTTVSNPKHVILGGGIHAREWISTSTMNYMIYQLIHGSDANSIRMRQNYVWHMFPVTNPEGYEYSFQSSNTRLWRKNRSVNSGTTCRGVDLNRNWGTFWGGPGASTSPCSDTYRGASAFSEPETQAMSAYILGVAATNTVILYMDIHCYSQFWLVPFGGTTSKPFDYEDIKAAGDAAAAAIQSVNGRSFRVGTPPDILYVASGGALDWGYAGAGIKYSYSPELRPATASQGGFVIPASNIIPAGEETYAGIIANVDAAEFIG